MPHKDLTEIEQRAALWRGFRLRFDLSQVGLAELVGISRRTVQMVENRAGINPHRTTIIKFNEVRDKYFRLNGIVEDEEVAKPVIQSPCKEGEKKCSRCRETKNIDQDFGCKNTANDNRESICKLCRSNEYLYRRGLSLDWYERTLASQGGGCAICKSTTPSTNGKNGKFCADHDHNCCPRGGGCPKCVRGLLCVSCNTRLVFVENLGFRYPPFEEYLSKFGRELTANT